MSQAHAARMSAISERILDHVLGHEGGLSDRAADRGGLTNWGITRPVLAQWLGIDVGEVTDLMLENLDAADARRIYRELFIEAPGFDRIADPALRHICVDIGINSGPARAVRMLQRAINAVTGEGLKADGVLGPNTFNALNASLPRIAQIYDRVAADRVRFYGRIISKDARALAADAPRLDAVQLRDRIARLQALNAGGWCNRGADFCNRVFDYSHNRAGV